MISVKNLSFQYEGVQRKTLDSVSFSISPGETVAIVGHNGSGKSTLAKHLNALLLPSEGSITVFGMPTSDPEQIIPIRQKVGMVFQNPDNQLVTTIVEEDVAFGPENLGIPPQEIRRRVDAALGQVGMLDFAKAASHSLSGGQKQRIAIAGALAMQPEVLILDESTAMLDPAGRKEILDTVFQLRQEKNMTVILITQYMDEAARFDRILVMSEGRLVMDGTPQEIFSERELLHSYGLEVPVPVQLALDLKEAGVPISEVPLNIDEVTESICRSFLKN